MPRKRKRKILQLGIYGLDTNLVAILIFIMVFGFIMIYSASYYIAGVNYDDSTKYLRQQIIYSIVGLAVMLVIANVDYHFWRKFAIFGYILSVILVLLLLVPGVGVTVKGATRWVRFGPVQFQIAEPIKLFMIIFMASLMTANVKKMKGLPSIIKFLLPSGIVAGLLLVFSDNMSTATILLGTAVFMIYVVHSDQWEFVLGVIAVIALVAVVLTYVEGLTPEDIEQVNFRLARIRAWMHPYEYEDGKAFQALQGLYAIGSGGMLGKGLGNSIQKLGKIPEPYNDYIFAIICEELGVFGAGLIILLFLYLLYRIFIVAQTAADTFGRMLAVGVFSHIALQVVLNLMVVTNLFPTTGVTLPFFSYGGTASVFLLAEMGLVLSVYKYSLRKRYHVSRERKVLKE